MCHALTRARTLAAAIGERGTRAVISGRQNMATGRRDASA